MSTEDKIVSLNDFKEDRKFLDLDGKPYTGFYTNYYDRVNDQQGYFEEYYKDGKLNGLSTWWHENGQKKNENHYKDGKLNGLSTWWYENGQKKNENHYKDGKLNGLSTWWYENGQKETENHYKDGKLNGLSILWYENGQKELENHYKDGKLNGLSTCWHENGQIEGEGFFKDGIQVDDNRTELDTDENDLPFTSNGPLAFIKNFCLTFFYTLVGLKFSFYILDAWF